MSAPLAPPFSDWPKIPYVGVGCIVVQDERLLLVRDRRGLWSTPGGHLDFGESPAECAARETREETGVVVRNIDFVALTNDVLDDVGKHYVTIWMRGEAEGYATAIEDTFEIQEVGWFSPAEVPTELHKFFLNLIAGSSFPQNPPNLPDTLRSLRSVVRVA
jgi:8-oxo-dGTP diphosphatase